MRGLNAAQCRQLETEGYVVVEDVLDPEADLAPVLDEYGRVLDGIAEELQARGEIASTYRDLPFEDRLIRVCEESGRNFPQHFDISLPQSATRHDSPIHVGPAVFGLLTNPRLLDAVEAVIGPEIASNPVQHVRMKLPKRAVAKGGRSGLVSQIPWHQDNGVILPEADEATILTVWLPLNEATLANGCMQVVPDSHRAGLLTHCPNTGELTIPDPLVGAEGAVPLPMRPGSILLMTQRTVHSSLDNTTDDQVRISFDLRYQPVGQPTGRPAFAEAGFVARSAAHPETVLRDPEVWAERWYGVRARLAAERAAFNRWSADAAACA
jgi:ectoine hydroxylase-related dioxygenase (phytanoyl-CoA dioxygenase family)